MLACGLAFSALLRTAAAQWAPNIPDLPISLNLTTGQPVNGMLTISEGLELKPLKFRQISDIKQSAQELNYVLLEKSGDLKVQVKFLAATDLRVFMEFENHGDKQRLLEVKFGLPVVGRELLWWDGREVSQPGEDQMQYERNYLRLPLSAAYNKERGVAVGIDPGYLSSMFAGSAEETRDGLRVAFRVRLVLDPGQKLMLPLHAFGFEPRYGYLDAVQRLYAMYPARFYMEPGVRHNLLTQGGGYLLSGEISRKLQFEEARRFGMGWEWAYCPAQRPGDWYPGERFWDEKLGYAGNTDAHQNTTPGTLEEFRTAMRERFHGGWPATALAYFMFPGAAEESYIKAYSDGLLVDQNGNSSDPVPNWIKTPFVTLMAYPWGNSYGEEVKKAIVEVTRDFQPSAIAFDEANRIDRQYGKGIEGEAGRAWDSTGVFCSLQVAMAHLADFVHTQKVREYTVASVQNKPWTYCSSTRADVAMHEWNAYEVIDCLRWLRLLMGHKPISLWADFKPETVLDWEAISPEDIRDGLEGIVKFLRLASLRDGTLPMKLQLDGLTPLVEVMPVLSELIREGWQPVPAMRGVDGLWLSRYGEGVKSFLVLGNPQRSEQEAKPIVDTSYLGRGVFFFSDFKGNPLVAQRKGRVTQLDFGTLKSHDYAIARALVQIDAAGAADVEGTATITSDPLAEGKVTARWKAAVPLSGELRVHLPDGAMPGSLKVGGVERQYVVKGGIVSAKDEWPAEGDLVLAFTPAIPVAASFDAVADFPFALDGALPATILLPAGAGETDRNNAQRIATYFDWYARRKELPSGTCLELGMNTRGVQLPITTGPLAADAGPVVELKQSGKQGISVSPDGRRLVVEGRTPEERELAVLRLLRLLDKRYPFVGVLPNKPIFEKAGVAGKSIP